MRNYETKERYSEQVAPVETYHSKFLVVLTVPDERERRYGEQGHVRHYGTDLVKRLRAPGWDVRVEQYAVNVDDATQFGLMDDHHIHVCKR